MLCNPQLVKKVPIPVAPIIPPLKINVRNTGQNSLKKRQHQKNLLIADFALFLQFVQLLAD